MITYDLNAPGQKYDELIEAIKSCSLNGKCYSYWKSSYMIRSIKTADGIVNKLRPFLDKNDSLIVIEVAEHYQGLLTEKQWERINGLFV